MEDSIEDMDKEIEQGDNKNNFVADEIGSSKELIQEMERSESS